MNMLLSTNQLDLMKSREFYIILALAIKTSSSCWLIRPCFGRRAVPQSRPISSNNEPLFYPRRMVSRSLITCDSLIRKSVSTFRFEWRGTETEVQPEETQAEQETEDTIHHTTTPGIREKV